MTKQSKHAGSPIKTGGSSANNVPPGRDSLVGKHVQESSTLVGTVPADASKFHPHSGHKIKD